jgi:hypothetical protein
MGHHSYIQGEEYLSRYPNLKKWIIQCGSCGQKGYRTDLPEHIHPPGAVPHLQWNDKYIKKYFKPLTLDSRGYCDVCSILIKD